MRWSWCACVHVRICSEIGRVVCIIKSVRFLRPVSSVPIKLLSGEIIRGETTCTRLRCSAFHVIAQFTGRFTTSVRRSLWPAYTYRANFLRKYIKHIIYPPSQTLYRDVRNRDTNQNAAGTSRTGCVMY